MIKFIYFALLTIFTEIIVISGEVIGKQDLLLSVNQDKLQFFMRSKRRIERSNYIGRYEKITKHSEFATKISDKLKAHV